MIFAKLAQEVWFLALIKQNVSHVQILLLVQVAWQIVSVEYAHLKSPSTLVSVSHVKLITALFAL